MLHKITRYLYGSWLALRLKRHANPIPIQDHAGHRFWQYPDDQIRHNVMRAAVTDSMHIVQYFQHVVKPGSVCIDIGANIGAITVALWSCAMPKGKVIAVEADPRNIARIKANLRLNHYADDDVLHAAVADHRGVMPLRCYSSEFNGWQTLGNPRFSQKYPSFTVDVETVTFEDLMSMYHLDRVDFVKIDVEGAEPLVFDGMRSFLKTESIKCVVFEVNHLTLQGLGYTPSDLIDFWKDFNYRLWYLDLHAHTVPLTGKWPKHRIGDCIALLQE